MPDETIIQDALLAAAATFAEVMQETAGEHTSVIVFAATSPDVSPDFAVIIGNHGDITRWEPTALFGGLAIEIGKAISEEASAAGGTVRVHPIVSGGNPTDN